MSTANSGLSVAFRRHPYGGACIGVTILCAIASWFMWSQVKALEMVRKDRAKEGEAMLVTLVGGSTQRQELATVREIARRIDEHLVVEANLAENHWYFLKLEEQTKVRLPELHQLNSPITDNSSLYRRIPYTLRLSGSFEQVAPFVLALETGPRLLRITSFNFSRGGGAISLDLSVELLGKK